MAVHQAAGGGRQGLPLGRKMIVEQVIELPRRSAEYPVANGLPFALSSLTEADERHVIGRTGSIGAR